MQYYQQIAQLQINYLLHDSLNTSELESAKSIAELCIYTYGAAVSNARALVSVVEDSTITWNDNTTCFGNFRSTNDDDKEYLEGIEAANTERMDKKNKVILSNLNNLIVYPNPASKAITFEYNNVVINSKIVVYDYLGKEIISKKILNENGKLTLDVNELNSGLYLYKLISEVGRVKSIGKFNIIQQR